MSSIDLTPGALFAGQFRIVRPLAKGGMGAVYVVEQEGTGRERALKLMHAMLLSDPKAVERFQREAMVASKIQSDHIVEVIATGVESEGPTPWLCMELLQGETLADRIERGPVPIPDAIEICRQLGHAIGAAHRVGVIHRDLKPENIFLSESRLEGVPFLLKVLDFGVAAVTTELQASKTTQAVGSPLWMAPEQTNVGKVVPQTDLWALGLIVFAMLTGQSYWLAARDANSTITALLVEIMVEPLVPASERARAVAPHVALPAGFDAWFGSILVRNPAERASDTEAVFADLHRLLSGAPTRASSRSTDPQAFAHTAAGGFPSTSPGYGSPARLPSPPPSAFGAATPAPVPLATVAPARGVWPWVALLAAVGLLAPCAFCLWPSGDPSPSAPANVLVNGQPLRVAGSSREATVSVNARGIELDLPGSSVHIGSEGVAIEAASPDREVRTRREAPDEAARQGASAGEPPVASIEHAPRESPRDSSAAAHTAEDELADGAEVPGPTARPRRHLAGGDRQVLPDRTTPQGAAFENQLRRCLGDLRTDGIELPQALYVFDGGISPRDPGPQQRLAGCMSDFANSGYRVDLPRRSGR